MDISWLSYFENPKPGISPAELDELEQRIGFAIPHSLRERYGTLGGGRFRFGLFIGDGEIYYDLHELVSAKSTAIDGKIIDMGVADEYAYIVKERGLVPDRLVPFAVESGGNFYCVDRGDESIWYADMELGNDRRLPPPRRIADSLVAFLEAGRLDEDD